MTPEKRIQNQIINFIKDKQEEGFPVLYERRQAGGFSYKKGRPDLFITIGPLHLEIEVKKPGGELSPLQEKFRDHCKTLNLYYCCVDSLKDFQIVFYRIFEIYSNLDLIFHL